jgi:hypothetical protein
MTSILRKAWLPRLSTSAYALLWAGVALHLFTVFVAIRLGGWLSGGLSLLFPVAAQAYWILEIWDLTGRFMNFMTAICMAYVGMWLIIPLQRVRARSFRRKTGSGVKGGR